MLLGGGSKYVLFLSEPYITGFVSVTYIFAITGTYHLPRNSCEFLCFGGGGSKYVFFLSEAYVIVFVSVTYIFTITGTYHLPRNSCEFLLLWGEVVSACFSFQSRILLSLCLLRTFLL